MINEILRKLGFTDKEIQVYVTILENVKIAPANIASITGIKRPTVYAICHELIKKGIITQDIEGTGGYFVALPPQHLNSIIEKEEGEINNKKKLIKEAISELQSIPKSKSYSVPRMRFVEEYNLKDFLYKNTPIWEKSMFKSGNHTWLGFQDHTLIENKDYRDWVDWDWKQSPPGMDLKLLTNDSEIEKHMQTRNYERRGIKFWKDNMTFTASNFVVGDYVVFMMTRNRPHYLVEIHDAVYAENMRALFSNLWNMIGEKQ